MAMYSSKYANIARPYARAAFDVARERNQLKEWKAFLEGAALIAENEIVEHLLANPELSKEKWLAFFNEILAASVDGERKNFLHLLAQNRRLILLPAISDLFNDYYAALEKISKVKVVTAIEVNADFEEALRKALMNRIQHAVTLNLEVDPAIIGGAIIHIGDRVIDASIREKLTRLLEFSLR